MENQKEITRKGNPGKPNGEEGVFMLRRMNESHAHLTGWVLSFFHVADGEEVLDIGCGGGAALQRMSGQLSFGHLTGIDYSPVSVALSQQVNAAEIARGKIKIIEASVEKMPFEEETFHKILTVESFYFWPSPENNLKEVLRVLKTGGIFLLAAEIYQKDDLKKEACENVRDYQLFNPTKEEFQRLFLDAGFSSVKIHTKENEDWICVEGMK